MDADSNVDERGNGPRLTPVEQKQLLYMDSLAKAVSKDTNIVLKGGGALLLGHGLNRFSNDLDFDATRSPQLEKAISVAAKEANVQIDGIRIRKDTDTVKRYKVDCISLNPDGTRAEPFTLKVEVSLRNKTIDPNQTDLVNGVRMYRIEALIDQKMGAFENRSVPRARDLSDMVFLADKYGAHFSQKQTEKLKLLTSDPDALAQKFGPDYAANDRRFKEPLDDMVLRLDSKANELSANFERTNQNGQEKRNHGDREAVADRGRGGASEKEGERTARAGQEDSRVVDPRGKDHQQKPRDKDRTSGDGGKAEAEITKKKHSELWDKTSRAVEEKKTRLATQLAEREVKARVELARLQSQEPGIMANAKSFGKAKNAWHAAVSDQTQRVSHIANFNARVSSGLVNNKAAIEKAVDFRMGQKDPELVNRFKKLAKQERKERQGKRVEELQKTFGRDKSRVNEEQTRSRSAGRTRSP